MVVSGQGFIKEQTVQTIRLRKMRCPLTTSVGSPLSLSSITVTDFTKSRPGSLDNPPHLPLKPVQSKGEGIMKTLIRVQERRRISEHVPNSLDHQAIKVISISVVSSCRKLIKQAIYMQNTIIPHAGSLHRAVGQWHRS